MCASRRAVPSSPDAAASAAEAAPAHEQGWETFRVKYFYDKCSEVSSKGFPGVLGHENLFEFLARGAQNVAKSGPKVEPEVMQKGSPKWSQK